MNEPAMHASLAHWCQTLMDTFGQHISGAWAWSPHLGFLAVLLTALVLLLRGATLMPAFCALAIAAGGGWIGMLASNWFALPLWPAVAIGAVGGFVLGFVASRLWLAVLLGAAFAGGGLAAYGAKVVYPYWQKYLQGDGMQPIGLRDPEEPATAFFGLMQRDLWDYFAANVPHFSMTLIAIVSSTALAGLVFGLLLPRLAKSVTAAVVGTILLTTAVFGLLTLGGKAEWAEAPGAWNWVIMGAIATVSFLYNVIQPRRGQRKPAPEPAPAAASA